MKPILCALCVLCGHSFAADEIKTKTTYAKSYGESKGNPTVDPAKDLPRYPAVEPKDAVATWKIKKGFKMELAASEPQVRSPIAISFDERGRMFVCEMIDYSEMRDVTPHLGRISMLEDKDGDGHYETSAVFADDLPWPTGLIWANGGLYVIATPDIWFFKDTKGTGHADVREKVFTGFGTGLKILNVQGLANCPQWGQDNRIHIQAGGGNRGVVTCLKRPDLKGVELGGRDFWFDPRTYEFGLEAGGAQYGMSFDNYGRKFACSNSDHLQFFVYDDRYAARNPYFTMPSARQSIAADGGAAEVYRISPDEPWRIVRTRWRIAGVVKGMVEGGGRVSGYFTGATGTTIYRGDAYGDDFINNAFVGDAGGQLVHRKKIYPDGVSLIGKRPDDEQNFEFAASNDTWVRVVNFNNAPDGCLYVMDMYREVIEHPWSIPDEIKKHLDLNSGNDRGRIWRIAPDNTNWKRRTSVDLSKASTAELVKTLEHPNGWHRDTASRLLYEKQDKSAVPLLEKLFSRNLTLQSRLSEWAHTPHVGRPPALHLSDSGESGYDALARFHAFHLLEGLGAANDLIQAAGLMDESPAVVEAALEAVDKSYTDKVVSLDIRLGLEWVMERISKLRQTKDRAAEADRLEMQLAFTLGDIHLWDAEKLAKEPGFGRGAGNGSCDWLEGILRHTSDPMVQAAALSAPYRPGLWSSWPRPQFFLHKNFGERILKMYGRLNKQEENNYILNILEWGKDNPRLVRFISAFADGLRQSGTTIAKVDTEHKLAAVFAKAADTVRDAKATDAARIEAINLVSLDSPKQAVPSLLACLEKSQPDAVQTASITALGQFIGKDVTDAVIEHWSGLQKKARSAALAMLLTRSDRATALLQAIEAKKIAMSEINASDAQLLFKHKDKSVADLANKVLAELKPPSRESMIAKFQPALNMKGDAARGQLVFTQRCIACHKAANLGVQVGPDLITVKTKGREGIMIAILDPNKEVAPQYIAYTVNTKDGQTLAGIITNDSANSMTLKMMGGAEMNIPRSNIKGSSSTGTSLMPEGIESGMSVQDMADLLDYIESLK